MTPDPTGAIIGLASIAALWYLYRNLDLLEDGNSK